MQNDIRHQLLAQLSTVFQTLDNTDFLCAVDVNVDSQVQPDSDPASTLNSKSVCSAPSGDVSSECEEDQKVSIDALISTMLPALEHSLREKLNTLRRSEILQLKEQLG